MSRSAIARPPKLPDPASLDWSRLGPLMRKYDITDERGRYLHWDKLKWRTRGDRAEDVWQVVKLKRLAQSRLLPLQDEQGLPFTFCVTSAMEAVLHQIVAIAAGKVAMVGRNQATQTEQDCFLFSSLLMEEAITSAQLEGAATTREVARNMLEQERPPQDEDEQMILNNYELLREAERMKDEPLSIDQILEFHRIATRKTSGNSVVPGELRQADDIYVVDREGNIAHQPPGWQALPARLQALCDFANAEHDGAGGAIFIAPVVKAIILHFMIGYEHPFRDGNGRTARALFYWYMLRSGYPLFRYVSISQLLKDEPKNYGYAYLYSETDEGDLTYFIEYQLDIIRRAFEQLRSYLQERAEGYRQIEQKLENTRFAGLKFVQKDLLKRAVRDPGWIFTALEISNHYGISDNTARTYLKQLVQEKLLLPSADGRRTLYVVPADLEQRLLR